MPKLLSENTEISSDSVQSRLKGLSWILQRIVPFPLDELSEDSGKAKGLRPVKCEDYKTLIESWRKAMEWTDGLDHGLSTILASITSTKSVGDQLWVKLIGPAACGKSTLCEAVSVSKYVFAKSSIRGFHSGFQQGGDNKDCSLIMKISGKTLVTKDGDTLLQSPNLSQILSEARDLYDTTSRSDYRNGVSRNYTGIRMTWILAGTSALRSIDSSELGERFIDCVIMDGIDDEQENKILDSVVLKAYRNMGIEADGKPETHQDPDMTKAMQLTGGYCDYLRENATQLLQEIELPQESAILLAKLGKFVAFMRARPSERQKESAEREFGTRLVSQHVRLAQCLAVVLNRKSIDSVIMDRVRRVSMDTARGQVLEICHKLREDKGGFEARSLALCTGRTDNDTRKVLRFLDRLGVIDKYQSKKKTDDGRTVRGPMKFKLQPKIRSLFNEVLPIELIQEQDDD